MHVHGGITRGKPRVIPPSDAALPIMAARAHTSSSWWPALEGRSPVRVQN